MTTRSTLLIVALLLGHLSYGQPTPFRGGLLTNETALLPAELATCGKVAFIGMNATESFIIGRTCTGAIRIWRKGEGTSAFTAVVSESDFGDFKLLSWAMPQFKQDYWTLPEVEVRPDGIYFTLMTLLPSGTAFNAGEGGSYRIAKGKLEKVLGPGDSINYVNFQGIRLTTQVVSASLPFPKAGGGEYIFLRTKRTNGVLLNGIFAREGTAWTLVLAFQNAPTPGLTVAYGLGEVISGYGIQANLNGTLTFLQRWSSEGTFRFEWVSFDPRTQKQELLHRYGAPILGVSSDYQATGVNSDTLRRYLRIANGPFSARTDYVAEAPNPEFKPWKWIIQSQNAVDMRGVSDYMATYLTANSPTDYQGTGLAVWDGKELKTLVSNGDTLAGVRISKVGNGFTNQHAFAPVSACTARFATYKADDMVESLWKFEKPCITAVADSAQVVLYGFNLSFPGYTPTILVDGVPVSGATITADQIRFPSTGIPSGTRKVQIRMANGDIYSNETTVSVPITIPAPAITSVVTATFENRPIAPGALFTIRGRNISPVVSGPTNLVRPGITVPIVKPGETFRLPTLLAGTRVLVNGREIPLTFVSCFEGADCQANPQMPVGVTGSTARVVVERYTDINGQTLAATSQEFTVQIAPVSPVVFKGADELPILQIADRAYQLVDKNAPAKAGETLVGYATGFGLTSPVLEDGLAAGGVFAPVAAETKAWLKFTKSGSEESREVSIIPFGSPQFAGVVQFNLGALPDIYPDTGTKVFISVKVGEGYVPDMELLYTKE